MGGSLSHVPDCSRNCRRVDNLARCEFPLSCGANCHLEDSPHYSDGGRDLVISEPVRDDSRIDYVWCEIGQSKFSFRDVRGSRNKEGRELAIVADQTDHPAPDWLDIEPKKFLCTHPEVKEVHWFDQPVEYNGCLYLRGTSLYHSRRFFEDDTWDQKPADGDSVEFRARANPEIEAKFGKIHFSIFCNWKTPIAENIQLCQSWRRFRYLWKSADPIWQLLIQYTVSGQEDETNFQDVRVGELDPEVGISLNGVDLLYTARAQACSSIALHARKSPTETEFGVGDFIPNMLYTLGRSIEFAARGSSGLECIDVFANGYSIPCHRDVLLDTEFRFFQCYLAPACSDVASVIVRVSKAHPDKISQDRQKSAFEPTEEFGVVVDERVGFFVCGRECLPTASFFSNKENVKTATAYLPSSSTSVRRGRWQNEGIYVLLPYRRVSNSANGI